MEMPVKRSNYSPLNQFDDQTPPAKFSDIGNVFFSAIGMQKQSSGSSYGGSSLSSDHYGPLDGGFSGGGNSILTAVDGGFSSSMSKSWAQQTEENYQLQLALALRLSSEAACVDGSSFQDESSSSSSRLSSLETAESISHRFWVNGCLSYSDKIPDGFYLIHGLDPHVWTMCSDLQENGRIPSIDLLKSVDPRIESSIEVVLIDLCSDSILKNMQNMAQSISSNCNDPNDVVDQLANLVGNRMGIAALTREDELVPLWEETCDGLKNLFGTVVLPIGSLTSSLCRHRALLFKVLADTIDLPCRIAKGCKYCNRNDATSCIVRFDIEREYLIDLIGKPGCKFGPDSLLNGPSSISISSPLRCPRFRPVEPAVDFRSLAKQYFSDCQSLDLVFSGPSTGVAVGLDVGESNNHKQYGQKFLDRNNPISSTNNEEISPPSAAPEIIDQSQNFRRRPGIVNDVIPPRVIPPSRHRRTQPFDTDNVVRRTSNDLQFEPRQLDSGRDASEVSLDMDDLIISWSDLNNGGIIGAGSFGTVRRAEWNGSDVAVKILMEQDFRPERCKEFLGEVAIMKSLRHPNIVLLMGAVIEPPILAIVTEYLSRGSLYRLLHKSGDREVLDERRRLSMAFDVAKGMNYLHKRNPPIVHRDLKSPNLLVDDKYTVKVCDFGLSRLKPNTFLSSMSAAGTPEWMAPEVLRNEQSNEKSDVYSFGVILWELATLQQPWINLHATQVVGAVGFEGKRLEIPRGVNPKVAAIIESCWTNEPWKRPSFADIVESLRSLVNVPAPQSRR